MKRGILSYCSQGTGFLGILDALIQRFPLVNCRINQESAKTEGFQDSKLFLYDCRIGLGSPEFLGRAIGIECG